MAHVADRVHRHVELLLAHATDQWQRFPEVEREMDQWDLIDQIVSIEARPLEEQYLKMLAQYAAEGAVTPDQLVQFEELNRIVEQNRPIIRRLQES